MNNLSTREAYGQALAELGDLRDDIVVLDADLSKSTKTVEFAKKFPTRFFNMGIAEQNLIGAACGLSTTGKIPFVSTFAVFATGRGFEIIRNSVCYPNLNVKICATHAGITVGEDGASHQSIEDISIMRSIPNMTVLDEAVKASILLKSEGISTRVINMSTIKPIDEELIIESAIKTGAIVTVEEHSVIGGLGSAVSEVVAEECPVLVKKLGINDVFGQSGNSKELLEAYGLTADNIVEKVKETIKHK